MKKFIRKIVLAVIVVLVVLTVLDLVYTRIYETAPPRNKFQFFRSLKNKKVAYLFLGSSRVENSIVPDIIYEKTHKKAINMGFQAAKLADIYTLLQLVDAYNIHCETIFIQIDYIYNRVDGNSNIFQYEMTPFIRENKILKAYSDQFSTNSFANYYIPFYRYCTNDLKLGFREVFANCVHKKTNVIANNGFIGVFGTEKKLMSNLPQEILDYNPIFDSIVNFSKKHKMNVVFYCAPFCKNNGNPDYTSKLKAKIPGFKDFSKAISEDTLFLNCSHLNDAGARRFTTIFTEELLMKKKEASIVK